MVEKNNTASKENVSIVTGVTGQDGSYLSELLISKGWKVVGVARRSSVDTTYRLKEILKSNNFKLVEGDITDQSSMGDLIRHYRPKHFYNLAAQSHVATSFEQPHLTWRVNAEAVISLLEIIRRVCPNTRFYQASTSEMFGQNYTLKTYNEDGYYTQDLNYNLSNQRPVDIFSPNGARPYQYEETPFDPQSPYAIAKAAAHHAVKLYRQAYGLHTSAGILFNHESERRGEEFVTRKITKWIGEYYNWMNRDHVDRIIVDQDKNYILSTNDKFPKLRLGNLQSKRDWGHAEDYVYAMYLMLNQDEPDDYVISSGQTHSVDHLLTLAMEYIGVEGYGEVHNLIVQDPEFMRPAEVDYLLGDSSKAKEKLGWKPKTTFPELVKRMVEHDIQETKNDTNFIFC